MSREPSPSWARRPYRELFERFGLCWTGSRSSAAVLLADTEDLYVDTIDRLLRDRLGVGARGRAGAGTSRDSSARPSGTPASPPTECCRRSRDARGPRDRPPRQANVELDLEERPTKSPRAFCAPIEVPGRVVLVIQPIGGPDDWLALFHEAGHTEHFAHTSASLPMRGATPRRQQRDRRVGGAVRAPRQRPGLARPATDFGAHRRLRRRVGRRRTSTSRAATAASSCTSSSSTAAASSTEMRRALRRVEWATRQDRAVERGLPRRRRRRLLRLVLPPLLGARGAAGRASERGVRLGVVLRREAGSLLRELWYEGQGMDADELVREVTGGTLDLAAVATQIREARVSKRRRGEACASPLDERPGRRAVSARHSRARSAWPRPRSCRWFRPGALGLRLLRLRDTNLEHAVAGTRPRSSPHRSPPEARRSAGTPVPPLEPIEPFAGVLVRALSLAR